MKNVAIIAVIAINLGGCYRSYERTSESLEPGECGNGVVEAGEQCDGGTGGCTGIDECMGFRWCNEDCTWGDCVSVGFGVLSGPVQLTEGHPLQAVLRTSTSWTGSRFGIFFSGTRSDPPMTIDAHFNAVSRMSEIEVPTHEVMGDIYNVVEIDAAWRSENRRFGIIMTRPASPDPLLFNLTDEDGWVLIDPGVSTPTDETTDVCIASNEASFGAMWRDVPTQKVFFGAITPEMDIISPIMLDELSTWPYYRLPSIVATDIGYAAIWHVDDPAAGESALRFARLDNDAGLISGIQTLFPDMQVTPPSAMVFEGDDYGVVFATQPYFDSPVLDLHFAVIDQDGGTLVAPLDTGRVRRPENRDADLSWTGSEYGIAFAAALYEEPDTERALAFRRYGPEGRVIGAEFRITVPGDVSKTSVTWDGEGYGVTYAVDRDGVLDVEFIRLGCIPPD